MGCGHRLDGGNGHCKFSKSLCVYWRKQMTVQNVSLLGAVCKNKMHLGVSERPQWREKYRLFKKLH